MTETVLTNEEIMHLWDTRVGEPSSSFPLIGSDKRCFARAIESAVLQSPEVVAMRKDAERYRWLRAHWHELAESYVDDSGSVISEVRLYATGDWPPIDPDSLDYGVDAAMEAKP